MFKNHLKGINGGGKQTPNSRPEDKYYDFEKKVKERFNKLVGKQTPIFKTTVDKEEIWNAYLEGFPAGDARDHYNCNACKHFIIKFGGLVVLDDAANKVSTMWDDLDVPEFFIPSVKTMKALVDKASIRTVFIPEEKVLGIPKTGEWSHLSATLPTGYQFMHRDRLNTDRQVMALRKEEYGMISRSLNEFSIDTINKALELLNSNTLYRGNAVLGRIKWLKEVKETVDGVKSKAQKENIKWLAVAIAPVGFCNVKSSMVGALLEDIQCGQYTYDAIKARFDEKMRGENYQRSQSDPTANQIQQAEKMINDLGLAESLLRRYATIEELPESEFIWKPRAVKTQTKSVPSNSIFGHLKAKEQTNISSTLESSNLPTTIMTWDKFTKTVLSEAVSIEALVDNSNNFAALVTAVNQDAENILQWNNPFSWYYHGGVDAEMKRRVEEFGGKHENNIIRCSLMWEGPTDLDLHCVNPYGYHMYYSRGHRKDSYGGYLDLDMNGIDKNSNKPVENIRWADRAPEGHYRFYVNNFTERKNGSLGTAYKAELEVNGQIFTCEGQPLKEGANRTMFEFDYRNGKIENLVTDSKVSLASSSSWNVEDNKFVKVNGIITSPNVWGDGNDKSGNHRFFLLDGCVDTSEGLGRGFFNEMLKTDLRPIRKTLEAYTAQTPIEGAEEATACGLGFSTEREWNLTLKVKTKDSTRLIKIDRFD